MSLVAHWRFTYLSPASRDGRRLLYRWMVTNVYDAVKHLVPWKFSRIITSGRGRAGPGNVGGTSEVALKMIRNNDTMRKAAQKEVALLKELAEHDPSNRKHCIR